MLMYILSVFDKKTFEYFMGLIFFIIHMFIVYKSQSRLSILISFFYFIYRYPKKDLPNIFSSIGIVFCFWIFI